MRPGIVPTYWLRGAPPLESNHAEVLEESRQHYATVRIQEFQRRSVEINRPVSFEVLLMYFRQHGQMYDQGFRLRQLEEDAT